MTRKITTLTLFAPAVIRGAPSIITDASSVFTRPYEGTLYMAANCSQPAVQAAVNLASAGDTVRVPAGTCTWDAAVTITAAPIFLQGAGSGAGGTKIIHGGGDHTLIQVDAGIPAGNMDISGFWFYGPSASWNGTALVLGGPIGGGGLRVHHNVFDGNSQFTMMAYTGTHGVVDHNTFQGSAHGIRFYGNGADDWASPLTLGTSHFFFVEDNLFDFPEPGFLCTEMWSGGRIVFRHNTAYRSLFDTHDRVRSGLASANAYEVYNNIFTSVSSNWKAIDITGGTGVIWNNTITGTLAYPIGVMDYKTGDPRLIPPCDGNDPADQNVPGETGWRCQYQAGTQGEGPTAYSYPIYVWSNTYNGNHTDMTCTLGCEHLLEGRDFFNTGTTPKPGYTPYTYPHPRTTI